MAWFKRTPAEAKAAQKAYARGDLIHQLEFQFGGGGDVNEALNAVAREGWGLHSLTLIRGQESELWGLYVFVRRDAG